MSDELQIPPVIDIDALLQPISDDSPSGEGMRYSGLYDEISEARRADKAVTQGDWQTDIKVADYRKVLELAVPALTNQTKDIQVAIWLTEALVKLHGFAGFRDGVRLVTQLQENFWDTLHPVIEDGDMEGRANAISWLDAQGSTFIQGVALTSAAGYGYSDWVDAKRFDIPENIEALGADEQEKFRDLKAQVDREGRVTADKWRSAVAQTRRQFCEQNSFTIAECIEALSALDSVNEDRYERNQMPGLSKIRKALEQVKDQAEKLLELKRAEEPMVEDSYVETASETSNESNGSGTSGVASGPIRNRAEALKRLAEIASFFQRTEPHSPVFYLIQRAVKWGNMPFETWLQDVVKDENVLHQIRETLGINSGSSVSYSEDSWDSTPVSAEPETTTESSSDDW
jgi:type VI secretion system protein ImpA